MGRDKQKRKEYDRNKYQKLKENDKNFLNNIAKKRREEREQNPHPHRESTRKWKLANPERVKTMGRDWCYRTKYGITLQQYNEILKNQNNVCLLCNSKTAYKTKGRNLCVDHDHETGKIRGLLCNRCNTMIGHIETIDIKKIIKYLS